MLQLNRFRVRPLLIALFIAGSLLMSSRALCAPSQQDVFKSISDNVNRPTDSRGLILFMCIAGGALIVLAIVSQRQNRAASPKPLLHHGKLLKEVGKTLPLRRGEWKQLSALAEATNQPNGEPVTSPLTILLCPSLLARGINNKSLTMNRRVLADVYKKLGSPRRTAVQPSAAARR